ncbi:hypothetical protein MUB04_15160 [Acinetobacter indicus]|uniref:hypothetical protein n=1 Tax=Acinetobacter TaxID=469 RepID=UPI0015D1736D|nr:MULTISPECIES: hypothetical protein [Acinetobacter]MCP0917874.1 hypothetical protein [Acinetobacter indicus]
MDMLYSIEKALGIIVSVEPNQTSVLEANVIADVLKELQNSGFKLDITNNGEYGQAYVENEWGNALLHLKSGCKGTIVVSDCNGVSLRLYFEFDIHDSILVAATSNDCELVGIAHKMIKVAQEKQQTRYMAA